MSRRPTRLYQLTEHSPVHSTNVEFGEGKEAPMMYQMIRQEDFSKFNMAVNNFLKDGWDLYGETKVQLEGQPQIVVYYQVMVKE